MTYRERREARADRLRGWADKREQRANATLTSDREKYRGDHAFNFQPGHIPERARVIARQERAFESLEKAASMSSRADGIESQLEHAIYSDDENAEQALMARIAELEAERDRVKAYNLSCRKGQRDVTILNEKEQASLMSVAKYSSYSLGKHGEMPAYHLTNLSGNINRNKKRLEQMIRGAA